MCYYITHKVEIDSSKTELYLNRIDIVELNLSNCINLEYLSCYDNKLIELDISNCVNLKYLDCSDNKLTQLNISNNINLEKLYCSTNKLTKLDLSKCINLYYLDCDIKTNIVNINFYINNENIEINQL